MRDEDRKTEKDKCHIKETKQERGFIDECKHT
jgi:hypothetical protein